VRYFWENIAALSPLYSTTQFKKMLAYGENASTGTAGAPKSAKKNLVGENTNDNLMIYFSCTEVGVTPRYSTIHFLRRAQQTFVLKHSYMVFKPPDV